MRMTPGFAGSAVSVACPEPSIHSGRRSRHGPMRKNQPEAPKAKRLGGSNRMCQARASAPPGPISSTTQPRRSSYSIRLVKRRPCKVELAAPQMTLARHLRLNLENDRHVAAGLREKRVEP